ncbi:hypothetical protein VK98_02530 [Chromobacterium sp. LK11]|nr:hypothetical protein VK98_02530 [Chromobacterium sp. LK11]
MERIFGQANILSLPYSLATLRLPRSVSAAPAMKIIIRAADSNLVQIMNRPLGKRLYVADNSLASTDGASLPSTQPSFSLA